MINNRFFIELEDFLKIWIRKWFFLCSGHWRSSSVNGIERSGSDNGEQSGKTIAITCRKNDRTNGQSYKSFTRRKTSIESTGRRQRSAQVISKKKFKIPDAYFKESEVFFFIKNKNKTFQAYLYSNHYYSNRQIFLMSQNFFFHSKNFQPNFFCTFDFIKGVFGPPPLQK